ncbi:hypothetical protein ABZ353_17055 [Streptomyces niveus]|uniref:hypothetical protein n=1 Tax=Streptomyces niveus TaxID=193462 RepID=UPI003407B158
MSKVIEKATVADVVTSLARDLQVIARCDAILRADPRPDALSIRRAVELIAKHSDSAHRRSLMLLAGHISGKTPRRVPPEALRRRLMHGRYS